MLDMYVLFDFEISVYRWFYNLKGGMNHVGFFFLQIRDTSVFVRLRPAWEDLRSYLTAKGRKRFEVFVCTLAERDYAREMWRLLDPEAHLISSSQLSDRVVCVKPGKKKKKKTNPLRNIIK